MATRILVLPRVQLLWAATSAAYDTPGEPAECIQSRCVCACIRRGRPRTGMVRVRLIVGKCAIMRRRQLGRIGVQRDGRRYWVMQTTQRRRKTR